MKRRVFIALNLDNTDSAELRDMLNSAEPKRYTVAVFSDPQAYIDTVRSLRAGKA